MVLQGKTLGFKNIHEIVTSLELSDLSCSYCISYGVSLGTEHVFFFQTVGDRYVTGISGKDGTP